MTNEDEIREDEVAEINTDALIDEDRSVAGLDEDKPAIPGAEGAVVDEPEVVGPPCESAPELLQVLKRLLRNQSIKLLDAETLLVLVTRTSFTVEFYDGAKYCIEVRQC